LGVDVLIIIKRLTALPAISGLFRIETLTYGTTPLQKFLFIDIFGMFFSAIVFLNILSVHLNLKYFFL
jgi:hypothetical protein